MVWADTMVHPTTGAGDIHLFLVLFTCKVIKLYTNPGMPGLLRSKLSCHLCFVRITGRQIMLGGFSIVQTGIYQSANSVISNSPLSKHHSSFYRLGRQFMFSGAGSEILWGMFFTRHPAKSNRQVMLTFYSPPDCVPKPRPGNRRFAAFNGRKFPLLEANV